MATNGSDSVVYPNIGYGLLYLPASNVNLSSYSSFSVNGSVFMQGDTALGSMYFGQGGPPSLPSGVFNTVMGQFAGQSITSGSEITCFGQAAGQKLTTGVFNTAIGQHAMGQEVSSSFSTAIGNDCMRNYISSGNNTGVGKNALYVGGGQNETALGSFAKMGNGASVMLGGSVTVGDVCSLTFTGPFTGSPITASYTTVGGDTLGNVATGLYAAIQANPTLYGLIGNGSSSGVLDSPNIVLNWYGYACGTIALTFNATGAATETATIGNGSVGVNNIALGANAMQAYYHSTGAYNIAVGKNSLYWLTTGSNNIAIGQDAGKSQTTGSFCTYLGNQAGFSNTTGTGTLAIGQFALQLSTGPGYSVALGHTALQNNVLSTNPGTSQANVAVGAAALQGAAGSTANFNVAVGASAGVAVTTAQSNVFIGTNAAAAVSSGNNHVLIGYQAGKAITSTQGATVIGASAGLVYTGGTTVIIGNSAATAATSGAANAVIIGAGAVGIASTAGSNSVVVGHQAGNKLTTGAAGNVIIGFQVATTTLATGSNNILIGTSSACDVQAASASALNIQNTIAGTLAGGTNPRVGAVGMRGLLGVLKSANFNVTTDQSIVIDCMTSTSNGYISSATKYVITDIRVMNGSVSLTAAQGAFYTGAGKTGTAIGTTTTAYTGCTGATGMQTLTAITNMDTTTFTAATLFLALTTGQGSAATADVYVFGYPLN